MVPVVRAAGPTMLAGGFARLAAERFGTELLVMAVATMGREQLLAMQTLALKRLGHPAS